MLTSLLLQALQRHFSANFARLKCFSLLVSAVILHRTVNLTVLATTDDARNCSNESRYRRFQDFFLSFALHLPSVARLVLSRLPKPEGGYVLAMDRTNWMFGRSHINFLVISCVVGKVSIPLVWRVLPKSTKRGNSNTHQRIALTKMLLAVLPVRDIRVLTMDREFDGQRWLAWLDRQEVPFVLRIKRCTRVDGIRAEVLGSGKGRKSRARRMVFGLELHFAAKCLGSGARDSRLLVVSNRFHGKEALDLYRLRWGIERLFGHLKKKGFDLESTHLTHAAKLEKLFAVLVVAFLFTFGWGCQLRASGARTGAAVERKSLFRLGLEDILGLASSPPGSERTKFRLLEFLEWIVSGVIDPIFLV